MRTINLPSNTKSKPKQFRKPSLDNTLFASINEKFTPTTFNNLENFQFPRHSTPTPTEAEKKCLEMAEKLRQTHDSDLTHFLSALRLSRRPSTSTNRQRITNKTIFISNKNHNKNHSLIAYRKRSTNNCKSVSPLFKNIKNNKEIKEVFVSFSTGNTLSANYSSTKLSKSLPNSPSFSSPPLIPNTKNALFLSSSYLPLLNVSDEKSCETEHKSEQKSEQPSNDNQNTRISDRFFSANSNIMMLYDKNKYRTSSIMISKQPLRKWKFGLRLASPACRRVINTIIRTEFKIEYRMHTGNTPRHRFRKRMKNKSNDNGIINRPHTARCTSSKSKKSMVKYDTKLSVFDINNSNSVLFEFDEENDKIPDDISYNSECFPKYYNNNGYFGGIDNNTMNSNENEDVQQNSSGIFLNRAIAAWNKLKISQPEIFRIRSKTARYQRKRPSSLKSSERKINMIRNEMTFDHNFLLNTRPEDIPDDYVCRLDESNEHECDSDGDGSSGSYGDSELDSDTDSDSGDTNSSQGQIKCGINHNLGYGTDSESSSSSSSSSSSFMNEDDVRYYQNVRRVARKSTKCKMKKIQISLSTTSESAV